MHIKHIHCMIEKLTECAKCEIDEKGIEHINTQEMGEVADMIKDLCEAEYYAKISKAMDESEYGEDYDWKGAYDEHDRKGYRGQPRDSRGRYMSRRGRRMGYEEPPYYHRMPDYGMDEMEKNRDLDKDILGRMYYAEPMRMGDMKYDRDEKEGRSGIMRKSYMETKEMHKDNSPESKQMKMKELENYMKELSVDISDMITDMSPEEKSLMKQKMQVLMQKIS